MALFGTGSHSEGEQRFYAELFKTFDPQNFGTIQGGQVFGFFLSSRLTKAALGDIWDEATQKQSGGLTVGKFINAMKLISLAQKGIAPKLANIAQHAPVAMPRMQYPAHLKKPAPPQRHQTPSAPQQQPPPKAAPPDPFGGLTSDLGFPALGSSTAVAVSWDTPMAGPGLSGHSAISGGDAKTTAFSSPSLGATPSKAEGGGPSSSLSPSSAASKGASVSINPTVNEYGPISLMKHSHTLTVDQDELSGAGGGPSGSMVPSTSLGGGGVSDEMKPSGLSRRQSTKMLYQEERLREQIRQAEQREKLAKKQANTQRIENERLERENETLRLEVNGARKAQAEALRQSQEALNSMQPLRIENEKLKQAINEWKELIEAKDEELEALEGDLDELRAKNERLENDAIDDKHRIDDLQFKVDRAEATANELTARDRERADALNALRAERAALEDERRTADLRVAQLKDELKRLKRTGSSGLGLDRNTLRKKEADLFNLGAISLSAAAKHEAAGTVSAEPAAAERTDPLAPPQAVAQRPADKEMDDGPGGGPRIGTPSASDSSSADKAVAPPGSHDFDFPEMDGAAKSDSESAAAPPQEPGAEEPSEADSDSMVERVVEEKVEIEETVLREVPFGEEFKASEWFLSASDAASYHKYFLQADSNGDGVIDGGEAQKFFLKSKLNRKLLAKIWVICDQKKQGKLSEAMFCGMFHIVMRVRKSSGKLSVPSELPECLREDNVLRLGTTVQVEVKEKKWVTQRKTVRVENPRKKKKKQSPPPLPQQEEPKDDGLGFGGDAGWDNDFSFDVGDGAKSNHNATKHTPNGATASTQPTATATSVADDANWNAFGDDFGDIF